MSNWNISYYESSGWVADGTIPRPNVDTTVSKMSNQVEVSLANGDMAYLTPEIKYKDVPLNLIWANCGETFKNKIETYVEDNELLKIVTHVSGVEFTGKFINIQSNWLAGYTDADDNDVYDIAGVFVII